MRPVRVVDQGGGPGDGRDPRGNDIHREALGICGIDRASRAERHGELLVDMMMNGGCRTIVR